ncbi:hypothetical protein WA1_28000 [Scytonema hofmannii PCC 7110]|uniref:Uncharacterized protein n=1 Tax=Scytonema hofmannii PCC 7110 TaxID=128403 RepID=A0A139X550_9CYAN|nr:hypothetical protein WA1_28000 [Scytonema hofmannii PCC 7110]
MYFRQLRIAIYVGRAIPHKNLIWWALALPTCYYLLLKIFHQSFRIPIAAFVKLLSIVEAAVA